MGESSPSPTGLFSLYRYKRWYRIRGYADGRANRVPGLIGADYLDGYKHGKAYWHRAIAIESARATQAREEKAHG